MLSTNKINNLHIIERIGNFLENFPIFGHKSAVSY